MVANEEILCCGIKIHCWQLQVEPKSKETRIFLGLQLTPVNQGKFWRLVHSAITFLQRLFQMILVKEGKCNFKFTQILLLLSNKIVFLEN